MNIQDVYQEELEKFENRVISSVKAMFEEEEEVSPVVFALVRQGKNFSLAVLGGLEQFFISEKGKDMAAEAIKRFSKEMKPLAIAFASEGWMSEIPKGEQLKGKPSEDPQRKEILHITFESYNQAAFRCWKIERDEKISLKVEDISHTWKEKDPQVLQGRFMNLLEESYSEFARDFRNIHLN